MWSWKHVLLVISESFQANLLHLKVRKIEKSQIFKHFGWILDFKMIVQKKISFFQCASTSSTPDCFDVIRGINLWNVETWIMYTFQGVHSTKPHIIFNSSKLLNYCSSKKCMEMWRLCDIFHPMIDIQTIFTR